MKSSKPGKGTAKGNLTLVTDCSIGPDSIVTKQRDSAGQMTTQVFTTSQESLPTTATRLGKWPSQLPANPNPLDNWKLYQLQSLRTVSGLRGELPTLREVLETSDSVDLTARTLKASLEPAAPRSASFLARVGDVIREWLR